LKFIEHLGTFERSKYKDLVRMRIIFCSELKRLHLKNFTLDIQVWSSPKTSTVYAGKSVYSGSNNNVIHIPEYWYWYRALNFLKFP
jgi:hypothetical protein